MSGTASGPDPAQLLERAARAARNLAGILVLAPLPAVALLGCGQLLAGGTCLGVAALGCWCLGMVLPFELCAALARLAAALREIHLRVRALESDAPRGDALCRGAVQALREQVERFWSLSCGGGFAALLVAGGLLVQGVGLRADPGLLALLSLAVWVALGLGLGGPALARAVGAAAEACAELRLHLLAAERAGDAARNQVPDPRTLGRLRGDFRRAALLLAVMTAVGMLGLAAVGVQLPSSLSARPPVWLSFAGLMLPLLACWLLLVAGLAWLLRQSGLALAALLEAAADLEAACRGVFAYREPFRSDGLRAAGQVLRILGWAGSLLAWAAWLHPVLLARIPSDREGLLLAGVLMSGGLLGGLVPVVLAGGARDFARGLAGLLAETEGAVERRERPGR